MKRIFAGAAALMLCGAAGMAHAEDVVRIGMTISNIPTTTGQPDQGSQGVMWTGLTLYDPLITFDFSAKDKPAGIVPALAKEWHTDPGDPKLWIFTLREDVKFSERLRLQRGIRSSGITTSSSRFTAIRPASGRPGDLAHAGCRRIPEAFGVSGRDHDQ